MPSIQRRYWNSLADAYQRDTRISVDDFHYGPLIPGERELRLLPPLRPGQTALELGCGAAQNSVWLARQGLACTALDISTAQLRHAQALARRAQVDLRLVRAPIETFEQSVEGTFDLIHSSQALQFVDRPADCLARAAHRLNPGGSLVVATVHPLYQGDWLEVADQDAPAEEAQPGLFLANYFQPPDDVRDEEPGCLAISRAYPVSAWFAWLRAAGLAVVQLAEPPVMPDAESPPYASAAWMALAEQLRAIPATLVLVAVKP